MGKFTEWFCENVVVFRGSAAIWRRRKRAPNQSGADLGVVHAEAGLVVYYETLVLVGWGERMNPNRPNGSITLKIFKQRLVRDKQSVTQRLSYLRAASDKSNAPKFPKTV